ncbi:ABC transporter ATP-binding protein [Knoellia subterranea]|uniref:Multidrug ABC transporter ATPase n=1 Tax=Knoellia subterranea KCTC 19937 TaxID=1385521 RepID=A0A0A0JMT3_9MICO|nr:ABC transporter ATP-binding protein [Knoellia subterranea]KGN38755.1 multidrug ABC transporter ATPase [Knoellia subterranea KCTC 19937]
MSAVSAVEVIGLRRDVGAVRAVDDASWSAQSGAVTAVLGPNGAGKTTTMECLEGLQRPTAGVARVLGVDPWHAPAEHRARVGVMLQEGGLPVTTTARRLLHHISRLHAAPADIEALMARLGVDRVSGRSIRRLSGGERQRVALAAALVGRPDVAFLDEPTAGLDPHARLDVWDLIRETATAGAAVVVTTHSFEEAERLADHVVIMSSGRVVAEGSLDEVRAGDTLEERYFALTAGGRR